MRVEKVIIYWNNFIDNNCIDIEDRVLVVENEEILNSLVPLLEYYRDYENGRRIIVALPQGLEGISNSIVYYDMAFLQGLMQLPSYHQLREVIIVCSLRENNIRYLIDDYYIDGKSIKISTFDIVAQGMLGMNSTPNIEDVQLDIDYSVIDDCCVANNCWNYLPKRNTEYDFYDYSEINLIKLIECGKIKSTDKVFLFGKTKTGLRIADFLKKHNIGVFGILDNRTCSGEKYYGYNVFFPYVLSHDDNKDVRVLVSLYSFEKACDQLCDYGLSYDNNIFIVSRKKEKPIIDNEHLIKDAIDSVELAGRIMSELRSHNSEACLNICSYRSSGDVYLICRYLQQDRLIHGTKHILVVASKTLSRVASLLGIATEIRTFEEISCVSKWLGFLNDNDSRVVDVNIFSKIGKNLHGVGKLSYNVFLNRMIFPNLSMQYDLQMFQKKDYALQEKYILDKYRTIILAPYAVTVPKASDEIWKYIVDTLSVNGYILYTNVVGDQKPLEGTEGITIPYESIIWCLEKCRAFIGTRSGLCDIISTADCKLVILYMEKLLNNTSLFDLYSLRKMGLRQEDLYEVDLDENGDYKEAIEWVLEGD